MINVLQTKLYDAGLPTAVTQFLEQCGPGSRRESRCVSATGAHGLVTAMKDPSFRAVLDSFFWNLPDGMPGVWIGKLKGARQMTRCYGPDFFKLVFENSATQNVRHFLCGGQEGVAQELQRAVKTKFGNDQVVGTFCPPFREMSEREFRELGRTITESGANVVWIGLSTPKQERFALKLAQYVQVNFIVTVGAAFDFHTDRVAQAPSWMQASSLEWLFRLLKEPKRLYKRYLEIVPLFILLNIKEFLSPAKQSN